MVNIPLFTGFYTSQVVGNGISEPSNYVMLKDLKKQTAEEVFSNFDAQNSYGFSR